MNRYDKDEPFFPFEESEAIAGDLHIDHPLDGYYKKRKKLNLLNLPLFQWRAFILFLLLILGILIHFLWTSELFEIPKDVQKSRSHFAEAKDSYMKTKTYWDAKQENFVQLLKKEAEFRTGTELIQKIREAPPEVLVSFLVSHLEIPFERLENISIFPREDKSTLKLVISKYESGIWPLQVMLSLEMEIKISGNRFTAFFSRLRRGSQDLATGLSWAYFRADLEPIKHFNLFSSTRLAARMYSSKTISPAYLNKNGTSFKRNC